MLIITMYIIHIDFFKLKIKNKLNSIYVAKMILYVKMYVFNV